MTDSALSNTERSQLAQSESIIQEGIQKFLLVGEQLLIIKQCQLFREGYGTFEEYMWQRWNIKKSAGYEWIAGYQLVDNIEKTSATADTSGYITSFTKLLQKFDPNLQVELYNQAVALAGNDKLNTKHIKQAIKAYEETIIKRQVYGASYAPIIQAMARGDITPQRALQVADTIKLVKPSVRHDIFRHQIFDPELIRLMDEKSKTNTYQEAVASGHLSVWYDDIKDYHELPLKRCTAKHFRDALNNAYKEHQYQRAEERNTEKGIRQISCIIHLGDGPETINELLNAGASINDLTDLLESLKQYLKSVDNAVETEIWKKAFLCDCDKWIDAKIVKRFSIESLEWYEKEPQGYCPDCGITHIRHFDHDGAYPDPIDLPDQESS